MDANLENKAWHSALNQAGDSPKNWWLTFGLSLVFGGCGVDRLYLGSYGIAFLKFVTAGGFFVWWLIDLILLLTNKMRDKNDSVVRRPF